MQFEQAQNNMSYSYFGGGPGVFVSGIIWLVAGFAALTFNNQTSMLTLFFGGMFIHPLGMLISKLLKRPGNHLTENPLGKLAIESTILIFIGLFLAFFVAKTQPNWFYPIMLIMIGGRYLIFNSLYGIKTYWLLGAVLALSGMACILYNMPFIFGAFLGGIVEVIFALFILNQTKQTVPLNS